jgi:hypothetical protein
MNIAIKPKNLINLKNTIDSCEDNYILFYKGKSIKFLDEGIFLVYLCLILDGKSNAKINCLLNKKKESSLTQLNEKCFIINKIMKIDNKDILSFKNDGNDIIKIENIAIKINKIN